MILLRKGAPLHLVKERKKSKSGRRLDLEAWYRNVYRLVHYVISTFGSS